MERKKIAVYGGSFNPPTMSHYEIMRMIIEEIKVDDQPLDEIWMIPCGDRIDKKISTAGEKRLDMCRIGLKEVFGDDPRYKVNNGRTIPTYFLINTLEEMHPYCDFYFVMGSDLLPSFKFWHRYNTLFESFIIELYDKMMEDFKFIIIPREGCDSLDESFYPKHFIECKNKVEDAFATSSTEIREILQWNNIIHHSTY